MKNFNATNFYRDFLAKEFPIFGIEDSKVYDLADCYDVEFGIQSYQALTDSDSEYRLHDTDSLGRYVFERAAEMVYSFYKAARSGNHNYDTLAFKLYSSLLHSEAEAKRIFDWSDTPLLAMIEHKLAEVMYLNDHSDSPFKVLIELVSRDFDRAGVNSDWQLSLDDWCGAAMVCLNIIKL